MSDPQPRIAVFAKAPVAGAVKTRLIPVLGPDGAARVHAALARHALAAAAQVRPETLQLWCSPGTKHPFFAECAARFGCELHAQRGADLGERMANAFDGNAPLVLIGTDCPPLTATHLLRAWQALRTHEAAIVPAEDGGYALIALARPIPQLFSAIAWGEASVMQDTRERLAAVGMRFVELETLWDVDRPEDYRRLRSSDLAIEVDA